MTEHLFGRLQACHDVSPHPAAMNMAIDEALLDSASIPTIRFYRWRSPALSFGYFGKFTDVAVYAAEHDLVRRWTGGGIVFHGDDLTYAIVIPASDLAFNESSVASYEKIHRALCEALIAIGHRAEVVGSACCADRTPQRSAPTNNCFANPVRADVMIDNRKIAGAAQRRTRRGLLQQGSIQGITLRNDLAQKFAQALSVNCSDFEVNEEVLRRARDLAQQKYGTESWLRMR
jgi:lipoyl(octanoyl) transferase